METNCINLSFFILKSLKIFGLNSLTCSKVIAIFLIFTKFTRYLMEVRHLVHYSK
jgi:hypothetical protein